MAEVTILAQQDQVRSSQSAARSRESAGWHGGRGRERLLLAHQLEKSPPAACRPEPSPSVVYEPAEPPPFAEIRRLAWLARAGDPGARAALLERLAPLVHGTARRAIAYARRLGLSSTLDRDDLVQEAQAALLTLMDLCDPEKGPPLLFFTVRLRAKLRQYVQAQARRRIPGARLEWTNTVTQELYEEFGARRYVEETSLESSGLAADLQEALAALSPRQQRLLYLFYWRQLTDDEIAASLHLEVHAAQQARYRALAALRARLAARGRGAPARRPAAAAYRPDGGR